MWYYYDAQNHNSVLGIREYAYRFGSGFRVLNEEDLPHDESCTRTCEGDEKNMFGVIDHNYTYSLFAYPAEDNFAGVKYPLSWIKQTATSTMYALSLLFPSGKQVAGSSRRCRVHSHEPPRPVAGETRLRLHVLLQGLRLPHGPGRPSSPQREPGHSEQALLGRRHRVDGERQGPLLPLPRSFYRLFPHRAVRAVASRTERSTS